MEDKNVTILRIYLEYGMSIKNASFWKKLWNSSLRELLLKSAKESNMEQANIFIAKTGYLNYGNISHNHSEIPSVKNPVCLELIDEEPKIYQFLEFNKEHLKQVKVVLINAGSEILFPHK